ncbi:hypothetical protein DERP_013737 [Dermatophagoides pteronyssinus]|uniref:Uncharacterized protein n=1 Tax=Dermatophagoides pteronyssinus TaxID=6956 RepID=A0ABQ8JFC6_DERPT|nr:hypothetical protein DERP_013737 [Dermatophagoides pteronyssinus]
MLPKTLSMLVNSIFNLIRINVKNKIKNDNIIKLEILIEFDPFGFDVVDVTLGFFVVGFADE